MCALFAILKYGCSAVETAAHMWCNLKTPGNSNCYINSCWTPVNNGSCCASCSTSSCLRLHSEGLSIGIWFNAINMSADSWWMRATISRSLVMKQWVAAASQLQGPQVDPKCRLLSMLNSPLEHLPNTPCIWTPPEPTTYTISTSISPCQGRGLRWNPFGCVIYQWFILHYYFCSHF